MLASKHRGWNWIPGMELNGQSLEIVENFCYLGNTRAKGGTVNSVTAIIRSGWSKFRDLSHFLSSRGLAL